MYKLFCDWCIDPKQAHLDLDPRLHTTSGDISKGGYIAHDKTRACFYAFRFGVGTAEQERDQYKDGCNKKQKYIERLIKENTGLSDDLESLRAQLKAAQEQGPVAVLFHQPDDPSDSSIFDHTPARHGSRIHLHRQSSENWACLPVFAAPIPAQPSPAVAVPDGWKLVPESLDSTMRDVGCAVRVTCGFDSEDERIFTTCNKSEIQRIWDVILSVAPEPTVIPSPRITEQDAREIGKEFIPYWEACEMSVTVDQCFDYWAETNEFSHLLNKLNNKTVK